MRLEGNKIFISAIGTDSGKTLVSGIFCKALSADYWKPIQTGTQTDSNQIRSWLGPQQIIWPETYHFTNPIAPHSAAELEEKTIEIHKIQLPNTQNNLIIEGAGGLMVPLNRKGDLMLDLIQKFQTPVVLVSNHYLGSINHTLLSIQWLKAKQVPILGIVFNGETLPQNESIILEWAQVPCLLRLPTLEKIDHATFDTYGQQVQYHLASL